MPYLSLATTKSWCAPASHEVAPYRSTLAKRYETCRHVVCGCGHVVFPLHYSVEARVLLSSVVRAEPRFEVSGAESFGLGSSLGT